MGVCSATEPVDNEAVSSVLSRVQVGHTMVEIAYGTHQSS